MNPDDEPRRTREGEDVGDTLRRLERTVEQLSRHTEELTRVVNETLTMLVRRVEVIEREVFPVGAAGVH